MKNRELFKFIRHAINRADGSDEMIDAALDFLHQLQYDYNTKLLEESSPEEEPEQEEETPVNSVLRSGVDLNDLVRHNCSGSTYVYLRDCGLISADVHVLLDFLYGELSLGGVMLRDNFKEVQPLIDAIENEIFEESSPESSSEEEPEQEEYNSCSDSEFDELVITAEEGTTVFHINFDYPDSFSEALEAIEDYPEEVVVLSDQSSEHSICVFCEGSNSYYWLCDVECLLDYDIESCQFMYKIYDSLDERSWLCTVFGSDSSFHTRSGHFCITACSDCFLDSFNFFIAQACVFSHSSDLHPH